ncbi:TrkH family potassium uptake protein [Ruminococcus sp.]|uniref:TrkH family potassium uptake protein n=1 Tax=Ruminococcus sp. TaxID=41978 RepID=UPI0025D89D2E|nr:TrkH family potassium uptake protein [Ruminococcus sp.]
MNSSIIRFILGHVMRIEALLMLLPCIVSLVYGDFEGVYYLGTACVLLVLGYFMARKKPENSVFYLKEGCIATSLSWILMSLFGCMPLWFSGEIPQFTNALFETISGFTTTGATILTDVEALSHTALFWRSFTHWIGGMGVLVFLMAIIPLSGGSNINLMRAESPGPSVGKLVPKMKYTARILYLIYLGMTVLEFIFLIIGRMPVFDSICTAVGTAGTGGFGIKNDSFASYSPYLQWVVTIFMILFGVNFNAYYYIIYRHFKRAFKMEEVRCYFAIIIIAVVVIFCNILDMTGGIFEAFTQASFQVASLMTSTGFSSVDFNLWPQLSKSILVLIMFVGACAGSTGGGIKVSRVMVLFKTMIKELHSYIHPKSIRKIKLEGKPVEHEIVRAINVYIVTFIILFASSVLMISFDGKDLVTNFTSVLTTLNNMGPGLNEVGPAGNFSRFSCFSKFVLMFDMLAGRLELFPLLILFHPGAWKDLISKRSEPRRAF